MNKDICRFVTLAVASVPIPADRTGKLSAGTHLVAVAMLIAERSRDGDWRFSIRSAAIGAGNSEDVLLRWATVALPGRAIVIGCQLADEIIAPLLDASASGDPETGRAFLDRLTGLTTALSVDLAISHGGVAATSFDEVASRHGIATGGDAHTDVESAWAFGNTDWLREHIETQAIACWQLWLAEANGLAESARDAFEQWLSESA